MAMGMGVGVGRSGALRALVAAAMVILSLFLRCFFTFFGGLCWVGLGGWGEGGR